MKKTSSWLWGLVLIALGVILGVNALGIVRIDIFFPGWWTLFIIVPSAVALVSNEHKGGPLVALLIGVAFLLASLNVVSFGVLWKLLLPALLVVGGLAILLRSNSNGEVAEKIAKAKKAQEKKIVEAEVVEEKKSGGKDEDEDNDKDDDDDDDDKWAKEEYWSTFSDQDVNYDGKKFSGCKVDAVFGGADVDLRKAKIEDEAILKASSVFGGIIVYVPDDVKVEVASTSIFGGVSDKRKKAANTEAKKTLYIEAACIFGGVEIR